VTEPPCLLRQSVDRASGGHAGVVDKDIEAAVQAHDLADDLLDAFQLCHIADELTGGYVRACQFLTE
jgi:hypothetical protein